MTRTTRLLGILALVGAGLAITVDARPAAATPGAGVFLLGDSVTESLTIGNPSAFTATITPAYPDAVIDGSSNRRTVTASTYQGEPVTSGLDEIKAHAGQIGDVIIVELGYNDCLSSSFPAAIDQILAELSRQDVPTVFWSMMSTLNRPEYASCNSALQTATARWPTLRLLDWDSASHGHPDWFANDGVGIHLSVAGRTAYATFLRQGLDEIPGIGVRPPDAQHCASSVAIGRSIDSLASAAPLGPTTGLMRARVPVRVLDSRAGRPLGAGRVIEVQIGGRSSVPATATAAVLNVTADQPCAAGYITVYPCGGTPPDASNLYLLPGTARPNQVLVQLGTSGRVCLASSVQTDVIADLSGWFSAGDVGRFAATGPTRVLDTRLGTGAPIGRLPANTAMTLALPDVPAGGLAAVLNVTAVDPTATGFLTAWPAPADGSPCTATNAPDTSNLNFSAGQTVANLVTVAVGPGGRVCLDASVATQVVADLSGWYATSGAAFVAQRPTRVLDTRLGTGGRLGPLTAGEALALPLDVPAGTRAAVLNVTVAEPAAAGFVKAWPAAADGTCSAASAPDVSNVNVGGGRTTPNLVTVALGGSSTVCFTSTTRAQLIADLFGLYR